MRGLRAYSRRELYQGRNRAGAAVVSQETKKIDFVITRLYMLYSGWRLLLSIWMSVPGYCVL